MSLHVTLLKRAVILAVIFLVSSVGIVLFYFNYDRPIENNYSAQFLEHYWTDGSRIYMLTDTNTDKLTVDCMPLVQLLQAGDFTTAELHIEELLAKVQDDYTITTLNNLAAITCVGQNRYQEADELLTKLEGQEIDSAVYNIVLINHGLVKFDTGYELEGAALLDQTYQAGLDETDCLKQLVMLYNHIISYDLHLTEIDLKQRRQEAEAVIHLEQKLYGETQIIGAMAKVQLAMAEPAANIRKVKKNIENAIRVNQKTIQSSQVEAYSHYILGSAYRIQGDYKHSRESFNQSKFLYEGYFENDHLVTSRLYLQLGRLEDDCGNSNEALHDYADALEGGGR